MCKYVLNMVRKRKNAEKTKEQSLRKIKVGWRWINEQSWLIPQQQQNTGLHGLLQG
jgi:hypothetical protein